MDNPYVTLPLDLIEVMDGDVSPAVFVAWLDFRTRVDGPGKYERDGHVWWRATATQLAKELRVTDRVVRRMASHAAERGVIHIEKHQTEGVYDHAYSYRVDDDYKFWVLTKRSQGVTKRSNLPILKEERYRSKDQSTEPDEINLSKDLNPPFVGAGSAVGAMEELGSAPPADPAAGFAEFWRVYPNKVGKKKAEEKFPEALAKVDLATIIAGAEAYAREVKSEGREKRFIKHPVTWLNAEAWSDYEDAVSVEDQIDELIGKRAFGELTHRTGVNVREPLDITLRSADVADRCARGTAFLLEHRQELIEGWRRKMS